MCYRLWCGSCCVVDVGVKVVVVVVSDAKVVVDVGGVEVVVLSL